MAIAGTNVRLNSAEGMDKITLTEKVTSPYFSGGGTELLAAAIVSESGVSATNETYYFGIANSSTTTTTEFHVAYGNKNGKGGDSDSDDVKSKTEVIYKQFANLLLPAQSVTGGFFISSQGSSAVTTAAEDDIYVLVAQRSLMKDRLNKKNWTIVLSGSNTLDASTPKLSLTDDSATTNPTATPVGDRYNIVSGSDGTVATASTHKTYGHYYPDMGILVFSGAELSASIPGSGSQKDTLVVHGDSRFEGFATPTVENANLKTALRFINCLKVPGGKLKFRDEEDQVSAQYFCRAKAGQFNFSNNPTFVSGSQNELRHTTMKGNPTTFISSVQLYNGTGDMVAVGNLSTPLKKNFSTEATIKVKLTY